MNNKLLKNLKTITSYVIVLSIVVSNFGYIPVVKAGVVIPTLTIDSQSASNGATINVPINASDFSAFASNVGSVTLNIQYDNTLLTYINTTFNNLPVSALANPVAANQIGINWFDTTSITPITIPNGTLVTLNFTVNSSVTTNTDLSFVATNEVTDGAFNSINTTFAPGVISLNPVATLSSIAITTPATKLSYFVGEPLDITGLVVTGTYSDVSTKVETITTANITGFNSSAPVAGQVLTITIGEKTTTYTVDIVAVPVILDSIAITTPANKLTYTVGDALDIAGLVVTGTYSDASTKIETITADNVSGFNSSAPAVGQVLTITVSEKTTTYTIDVVAPLSSAKNITSFSFAGLGSGVINEINHTIAVSVPFGTAVTALEPTITIATGASVNPNTNVAQNFTNPVIYIVTAEDSSTQAYTVTVTVAANPAKDITAFSFSEGSGVITGTNIAVTVPFGTNITALIPTITLSGGTVSPLSGVAQDFINPVTYTVTAADSSTQTYTVAVTIAPNTAANILSFNSTSPVATGVISGTNITLTVPFGTNLTDLPITITLSSGASVLPTAGNTTFVDGASTTYTVTAQNGVTTQNYSVTVNVAANTAKDITSFNFVGLTPNVTSVISGTNITLDVPYGTDVSVLVPTIAITGASVNPASSVAQDFTNPVIYTVTAADSSTQTYTVTVIVAAPSDLTVLTAAITTAQGKHNTAIEGNLPGQYPTPLKANLQTAINNASAVTNASAQSVVDAAVITLNAAITTFEAGVVPPDTVPPIITLNGDAVVTLHIGDTYTEAGATATDMVDGSVAVTITGTVATSTMGEYIITYKAVDAAGNEAIKTRTVNVVPVISSETPSVVTTTSITATWTTDHPATSRVIYDTTSHPVLIAAPNYGYTNSTIEDSTLTTSHSVTVTGLSSNTTYYLRTVSHGSPETVGIELTKATAAVPVSSGGGGGGGGGSSISYAPTSPNVLINNGDSITYNNKVRLKLSAANMNASYSPQMAISNSADFAGVSWTNYATSTDWTLLADAGVHTVYVKFKNNYGTSAVASDAIELKLAQAKETQQTPKAESVESEPQSIGLVLGAQLDLNLSKRLKGRLLLQVQQKGAIWYVDTKEYKRYSVTWANALPLFQKLSLGISNADLNKIPLVNTNKFSATGNRLKGKLLLQVEDKGRIWYVDTNGRRQEVTWKNLRNLFESLALGITNANLDKIEIGNL